MAQILKAETAGKPSISSFFKSMRESLIKRRSHGIHL